MSSYILPRIVHNRGKIIYDGNTYLSGLTSQFISNECKKRTIRYHILSKLDLSTITVKGKFSHINYHEKDFIKDVIPPEPEEGIHSISNNFGRKTIIEKKVVEKSTRGRKKTIKKESTRKKQGNGKSFASQTTFEVRKEHDPNQTFQIKLFRTGIFNCPGGRDQNFEDLIYPLNIVRKLLRRHFKNPAIDYNEFSSAMRNFKCFMINKDNVNDLVGFKNLLIDLKYHPNMLVQKNVKTGLMYQLGLDAELVEDILDYSINNLHKIGEISYNTDRRFYLSIKFIRVRTNGDIKDTTVKVFKDGKININGANSELDAIHIYNFLGLIYDKYHCNFVESRSKIEEELLVSVDYDEALAIYDSE